MQNFSFSRKLNDMTAVGPRQYKYSEAESQLATIPPPAPAVLDLIPHLSWLLHRNCLAPKAPSLWLSPNTFSDGIKATGQFYLI